jgi:polar amino acid transport system permease protein
MALDKPKRNNENDEIFDESRKRAVSPYISIDRAPYWLIFMLIMWAWFFQFVSTEEKYSAAFNYIKSGVTMTIGLSVASYAIALFIGLVIGVIRSNPPHEPETALPLRKQIYRGINVIIYNVATFYVEFVRGVPSLVFLLIAGYIVVPAIRNFVNVNWIPPIQGVLPFIQEISWRAFDPPTAIAGLSLIYGAFLSEVFRAGIQAVPIGQREAAKSVGMTDFQTMRLIIVPQAIRNVLPPLGNDFIAMIKDTSLVTILGTQDITQLARKWAGSVYTYEQTYAVLGMMYLTMTVTGSLLVQVMERNLRKFARR